MTAVMDTLDEFTLHARLAGTPGIALVLFSRPTCGTDRRGERLLPAAMPPQARLFEVDVQHAQAMARDYAVFHLPALFLFRDGHYQTRLNCEVTPAALGRAIETVLSKPAEEES